MSAPLIGISGKAGAGKDSLGEILVRDYGYKRYAFADKLKEIALDIDPVIDLDLMVQSYTLLRDAVDINGWERAKKNYPGIREFLQNLGTALRKREEWFWVDLIWEDVVNDIRNGIPVVITDMRMPNEIDVVATSGGLTVRIERPAAGGDSHVTETALDDYPHDFTVVNDGSLEQLRGRAAMAHTLASRRANERKPRVRL